MTKLRNFGLASPQNQELVNQYLYNLTHPVGPPRYYTDQPMDSEQVILADTVELYFLYTEHGPDLFEGIDPEELRAWLLARVTIMNPIIVDEGMDLWYCEGCIPDEEAGEDLYEYFRGSKDKVEAYIIAHYGGGANELADELEQLKFYEVHLPQAGGAQGDNLSLEELRTLCNKLKLSCRGADGSYLSRRSLIQVLRAL